jgi:hypothetical protein
MYNGPPRYTPGPYDYTPGVPDGHTTLTEARNLPTRLAKLSEISAAIRREVPVYTHQPPSMYHPHISPSPTYH